MILIAERINGMFTDVKQAIADKDKKVIQERQRLATLGGDKMMAMPSVVDVGSEAWRAKEAKSTDAPDWGPAEMRGPMWEASTAIILLQSGVDIIRLRHPKAVATVKNFIKEMW